MYITIIIIITYDYNAAMYGLVMMYIPTLVTNAFQHSYVHMHDLYSDICNYTTYMYILIRFLQYYVSLYMCTCTYQWETIYYSENMITYCHPPQW